MTTEPLAACKTCRWWAVNANGNPNNLPVDAAFACLSPMLAMTVVEMWGRNGAGIDDGDGKLVTGPEFGCVHHWQCETKPIPKHHPEFGERHPDKVKWITESTP